MPFSGFEVLSIKMRMLLIVLLAAVALPAQSRKWLIAIVGISHESNSFNVHPTRLEDFRQSPDVAREDFTREAVKTHNDPELAQREARRLSDMLWGTRDQLTLRAPAPAAVWFEGRRYEAPSE